MEETGRKSLRKETEQKDLTEETEKNRKMVVNSREILVKFASDVLQTTTDKFDIKWWGLSILHGEVSLKTVMHCQKQQNK